MPLHEGYLSQINKYDADLANTGGRAAGVSSDGSVHLSSIMADPFLRRPVQSCTAAIFLKRFVEGVEDENVIRWAHLDIAGVMDLASSDGYNRAGMTGRPVRTLIEFARRNC